MDDRSKPEVGKLTALELRRKITVAEAARLNGISADSFRRHYPHLIKKITKQRVGVVLRDALAIGQQTTP